MKGNVMKNMEGVGFCRSSRRRFKGKHIYIYEHDARVARDRAAKTSMAHMTGLSGREVKEDSNWCL